MAASGSNGPGERPHSSKWNPQNELKVSLDMNDDTCLHCNGFYGPSFGDPICSTCHDFLYVEDFGVPQLQQNWAMGYGHGLDSSSGIEKDDGDSGNDEPSEDAAAGPAPVNGAQALQPRRRRPFPAPDPDSSSEDEPLLPLPAILRGRILPAEPPGPVHIPIFVDVEVDFYAIAHPSIPLRTSPQRERMANRLSLLTSPLPKHQLTPTEDLTPKLPTEIWGVIFQKLDTISLLMASKVSSKWNAIIRALYPSETWKEFVSTRWPLFRPVYEVTDWYSLFADFVDSIYCKMCWINMNLPTNLDPAIGRCLRSVRLNKELKWLREDHPEGIEALPLDNLNYNWLARVNGPAQSPYQGGVFYLNLKIPHDYPLKPPLARFLTKIYHPNVSRHGDIGIDSIQHNWTLALTIPQILLSIQSLLTDPCTEPSMESSIAAQYVSDKNAFDNTARVWTWQYAMHDVLVH